MEINDVVIGDKVWECKPAPNDEGATYRVDGVDLQSEELVVTAVHDGKIKTVKSNGVMLAVIPYNSLTITIKGHTMQDIATELVDLAITFREGKNGSNGGGAGLRSSFRYELTTAK